MEVGFVISAILSESAYVPALPHWIFADLNDRNKAPAMSVQFGSVTLQLEFYTTTMMDVEAPTLFGYCEQFRDLPGTVLDY
jgi:hypothetical protein